MEFERYEDVIDAFERDNMGYETLTDYIKGNNIKIAEIDMSPMGDLAKAFNKKDGGMMIAIEQLGKGGITGGKTYHQYHDQFVPPDSESERYANGGGVGSMMQPKKKFVMQGDKKPARNYLGKQKTVSNVPLKWQSGPNTPPTELAYITKKEKNLLLKKDLHGSLKDGPNTGPDGIMSLDSQGDYTRDRSPGAYGGGSRQSRDRNEQHMREILTGQKNIGQTVQTGPKTRKYAVPEYVNVLQPDGTYKNTYVGSGYKSYGQPSFFGNLFSRGAPGYRGIKGMPAFGNTQKNLTVRDGPLGMGYYSDEENFGETRDAVPFGIMGIIGNILSKAFPKKPKDMTEFNKLQLVDGQVIDPTGLELNKGAFGFPVNQTVDTTGIDNSLALQSFFKDQKPPANVNVNNDMQTYMEDQTNFMGPVTSNYPGGEPNQMQEFLTDEQNYVGPVTGVNYPGGAPNVMQEYMDDQTNTGNMIDNRYVTEEMGLQGDGSIQNQNFMNQDYGIINSGINNNFAVPNNLVADASTNTNQELLESIINKDMYEKNLKPAFDKQQQKKNILEQMMLEESTLT